MSNVWPKARIKDFAEVITGGTPSTSKREFWENGTIPWLNSGELNQGEVLKASNFITDTGLKNSAAKMMPPESVLIALTGATTGITAFLGIEACANQSVTGILPSKKHNSRFLYHYLGSIRRKILRESYGGAQKHISQGYVKELEIPLPPLSIQQKIAAILDKADQVRKKDQQLLAKYDELIQSIFYDMFGDPVKNEKGWEVMTISEVSEYVTKGESPNWQGYEYLESGIRFITSENVLLGELDLSTKRSKFVPLSFHSKLKRSQLEEGNILINLVGASIGRCALVSKESLPANINQAVASVKLDQKKINPLYCVYLCLDESYQKILKGNIVEAARANISLGDIRELKVPIPPIEIQNNFSSYVMNIKKQKINLLKGLSKSDSLFKAILNGYFNHQLKL